MIKIEDSDAMSLRIRLDDDQVKAIADQVLSAFKGDIFKAGLEAAAKACDDYEQVMTSETGKGTAMSLSKTIRKLKDD